MEVLCHSTARFNRVSSIQSSFLFTSVRHSQFKRRFFTSLWQQISHIWEEIQFTIGQFNYVILTSLPSSDYIISLHLCESDV